MLRKGPKTCEMKMSRDLRRGPRKTGQRETVEMEPPTGEMSKEELDQCLSRIAELKEEIQASQSGSGN